MENITGVILQEAHMRTVLRRQDSFSIASGVGKTHRWVEMLRVKRIKYAFYNSSLL